MATDPFPTGWLPFATGARGACGSPEDERSELRAGVNHFQKILFRAEEVPRDETRLRSFPGLWKSHRLFKCLLWITCQVLGFGSGNKYCHELCLI